MSRGIKPTKSLDEMFGIIETDENVNANNETGNTNGLSIQEIAIENLVPFSEHEFPLYEGERLEDMVNSIKEKGIYTPLIVRTLGDKYEILAGHNRSNAGKLAGLHTVPCIVKECSDEEAWRIVIVTNVQQRGFKELLISEQAKIIYLDYTKAKRQGQRNDINNKKENVSNADVLGLSRTSGTEFQKLENESLKYYQSKSDRQNRKYVNLYLFIKDNETITNYVNNKDISITIASDILSSMKDEDVKLLDNVLGYKQYKVDKNKAETLRELSLGAKLTDHIIQQVLEGSYTKKKKGRPAEPKFKPSNNFNKKIFRKYFDESTKQTEIEDIIEDALTLYFNSQSKLYEKSE